MSRLLPKISQVQIRQRLTARSPRDSRRRADLGRRFLRVHRARHSLPGRHSTALPSQQIGQLHGRLDLHLVKHPRTVNLHGAHADLELVGNQLVG